MDNNAIIDILGIMVVAITMYAWRNLRSEKLFFARIIRSLMMCCMGVMIIDIPGLIFDGMTFPCAKVLLYALDTAYWVLHVVYCRLWMRFTYLWATRNPKISTRLRIMANIPLALEIIVIAVNPWTGWLFTLDNNTYAAGGYYYLCLIPIYYTIAFTLFITVRGYVQASDMESKRRRLSLMSYMFLPVCGAIMEILAYGVSWVWPMISLSLLLLCLSLQQQVIADERLFVANAAAREARIDAEVAKSKMSIMLSQIQPHFLYNALCVIQDLCNGKAPEAEKATIAFSRFLRANMDSLKADKPIPFVKELEHAKYYLELEKMRFGERLNVEYKIEVTDFALPAMTVQPLVENAVRYGIMKCPEGGTVRISSKLSDDYYVVTIEDDGVGFDPYQRHEDGRTHVGIDNVRSRLADMAKGDLLISSVPGVGTACVITVPTYIEN